MSIISKHCMCSMFPTVSPPQESQSLQVSFVESSGTADHCYYNSKWYSPGQNLVSRSGDICTCINRDKITCARSNNNNNQYHNQPFDKGNNMNHQSESYFFLNSKILLFLKIRRSDFFLRISTYFLTPCYDN